jgi:hypothetical protein
MSENVPVAHEEIFAADDGRVPRAAKTGGEHEVKNGVSHQRYASQRDPSGKVIPDYVETKWHTHSSPNINRRYGDIQQNGEMHGPNVGKLRRHVHSQHCEDVNYESYSKSSEADGPKQVIILSHVYVKMPERTTSLVMSAHRYASSVM